MQAVPAQGTPQGARLAPDGHHYIFAPHAGGNWRKVVRSPDRGPGQGPDRGPGQA